MLAFAPEVDVAVAVPTPPLTVRSRRSRRATSDRPNADASDEPVSVSFHEARGLLERRLHGSATPRRYGSGVPPQTSSLFSDRPPCEEE